MDTDGWQMSFFFPFQNVPKDITPICTDLNKDTKEKLSYENVPKDISPICIDLNKNTKKIIICSKNIYRPCIYMLICNANVQSMRPDMYYIDTSSVSQCGYKKRIVG